MTTRLLVCFRIQQFLLSHWDTELVEALDDLLGLYQRKGICVLWRKERCTSCIDGVLCILDEGAHLCGGKIVHDAGVWVEIRNVNGFLWRSLLAVPFFFQSISPLQSSSTDTWISISKLLIP
jgi:hypothetical protein